MKATFALGRGRHAFLSHHLGDLEYYEAQRAYRQAVPHYEHLFGIEPELVVHDLHPDYTTTRYAQDRDPLIPRLAVQHHHAHVASCMADNLLDEPVIGVAFDGTGLGTDGAIWGGEFLTGGYRGFRRAAHLRYVPLPGGDQAIREPWRMAAAYLVDAGQGDGLLAGRIHAPSLAAVRRVIDRRINTPLTSSAGRLFDGVASLLGVRDRVTYEGQAAVELEWLAAAVPSQNVTSFDFNIAGGGENGSPLTIDTRHLIAAIADAVGRGEDSAQIARRFHTTLVEVVAEVCARLRQQELLDAVVLSGGVFQNALFTTEVIGRLERDGFRVYRHRKVPPGDGGLSLGQLAVAAAVGASYSTRRATCADPMAVSP